jgi:cytochrome o ubiquinol oxidase subunit 2
MRFDVVALAPDAFTQWLSSTRASGGILDAASYAHLAQPGTAVAPTTFGSVAPKLFEAVVMSDITAVVMPPAARPSGESSPQPRD